MPELIEAVIVATARSPIGRANKGSFVDVRADELMATILNALMDKVPEVDKSEVVDIICGNVAQQGETGFSIARTSGLLAGFPYSVPGLTVNRFCSSSLQSIRSAAHAIGAGEGHTYIAAGVEKSSRPPVVEGEAPAAAPRGRGVGPGGLNPKLLGRDSAFPFVYIPMGLTAENVAERFKVSREDQDAFAKLSQDRAVAAQADGFFEREITPITKEDGTVVAKDDCPRPGTTLEKLAELQPSFKPEGGTVTAGNACPLNDGAAAVIVMSDTKARELGITPLARIVASGVTGLNPEIMGLGPVEAIRQTLKRAGMTIDDIDLVEINEAFAAQVVPSAKELGISYDKLNVRGGAIALGHPFGQTGARIMTTLLNALDDTGKTIGLESMCVGGGQGMAMIVERLS
jgi:acetyl-CoA C-acetyltransferase